MGEVIQLAAYPSGPALPRDQTRPCVATDSTPWLQWANAISPAPVIATATTTTTTPATAAPLKEVASSYLPIQGGAR
jgi:hypothetical protein